MLELGPKNQSKVKVVNVTEARGNFARILSDTSAHYIITKNNRAQRVIINFDEFKILQELAEAYQKEHGNALPSTSNLESPPEPEMLKSKPPAIRGMIAAQFEWVQKNNTPEVREEEPFVIENVKSFTPEEVRVPFLSQPENFAEEIIEGVVEDISEPLPPEELAQDFTTGEEDYFSADDSANEVSDCESVLPEPSTHTNFAATFNSDFLEAPEPTTPATVSAVEEVGLPTPEAVPSRTPEQEEYFRRYRKLYEGFLEMPPVEPSVVFSTPQRVIPTVPEVSVSPQKISQVSPAASTDNSSDLIFSTEDRNARYYDLSSELHSEAEVEKAFENKVKADDGLPSLQELLKDLDSQKLSGEENETLDVSDIDEIISRITTD